MAIPEVEISAVLIFRSVVIIYLPDGTNIRGPSGEFHLFIDSLSPSLIYYSWCRGWKLYKKLSYRRKTARQPPSSAYSSYSYAYGRIRNSQQTYVKRAVHWAHFKMNRTFKVIQGHLYWCLQESRTVSCRNVQLMPTLFLRLTKIWQRENSKFVDFNDPTQVWRRRSKKRLRISTNDLYCQKLESLTYILPLIVLVYLYYFSRNYLYNLNLLILKMPVRKPSFTWNSHSRSF